MISLFFIVLLGTAAGIFTGLIPGIHIDLVAVIIIPFAITSKIPPNLFVVFIISMAITHTFVDFIPSIFLGAPSEDTALSTLPGHELLLRGEGHRALQLTLIGSTIATSSLIIIIPLFIFIIPKIFPTIQKMMGFILIWTAILLIYNDKHNKIKATTIFILSGFLGIASLNLNINQPLIPLFAGLFGASTITYSIKTKTILPKQEIKKLFIQKKQIIKPTISSIIVSPICSLLPGIGSSQAAIIASEFSGKTTREQFLILLGSINTTVMAVSFLTLILFKKSRSGAAYAISQITRIATINLSTTILTIIISSLIAIPITLQLSKIAAKNIHKIPYTKISITTLIFLSIIITIFTGLIGFFVFIISTALGITCIEFGTKRSFLMGAILVPTILFYLPF